MRKLLIAERLRRRARPRAASPAPSSGLGEPPAPEAADDAQLDELRGELIRELDRLARAAPDAPR